MLEFASNTTITITVPHEYLGNQLTLTDMKYEVLDADSNVLVAKTSVPGFSAAEASTVVTISAATNTTTAKRDVRLLNCYLINADGEYIVSQVYMLKGNQLILTPLLDSFMTFADSMLTRVRMAEDQEYFDSLTDELKAIALEEAFNRICKLKFKVGTTIITDIKALTVEAFSALDAGFLLALKKAQIAEANMIVENSPIRDKIRAGIISETIGESSMFFSRSMPSGKFHGLADDSYDYLKPYVYRDVTSSQTWKIGRA
jgi:hypothetical protein